MILAQPGKKRNIKDPSLHSVVDKIGFYLIAPADGRAYNSDDPLRIRESVLRQTAVLLERGGPVQLSA
jgi:hypothetical protein